MFKRLFVRLRIQQYIITRMEMIKSRDTNIFVSAPRSGDACVRTFAGEISARS